ncbi:MAG: hypothetical protein WKF89_20425, partial [Chitinophagaceae bacterium]
PNPRKTSTFFRIAAMWVKKEYTLEQIFKAYLQYSGNSIGKLKTFLSEFRNDNSFIKHAEKLKQLKIKKLL